MSFGQKDWWYVGNSGNFITRAVSVCIRCLDRRNYTLKMLSKNCEITEYIVVCSSDNFYWIARIHRLSRQFRQTNYNLPITSLFDYHATWDERECCSSHWEKWKFCFHVSSIYFLFCSCKLVCRDGWLRLLCHLVICWVAFFRLRIQFKLKNGEYSTISPDNLFRRYLEYTTILLDKEDDLVFQFGGNVYINTLSVKLRLKVVTTGYRAQNISNFNTAATHYDVLSLLWNETVGTVLYPSMRKKTVSCQFFLSLQIIANQTTTRYLHTSLTMIPIIQ